MRQTVEALLDVVYRHYPSGVSYGDPRYKRTDEFLRLMNACREAGSAGAQRERWRGMLRRLGAQLAPHAVHDNSMGLAAGAAGASYEGMIDLPNKEQGQLHFLVSILGPHYLVFSSRLLEEKGLVHPVRVLFGRGTCVVLPAGGKPEEATSLRLDLRYELSPEEGTLAGALASEIEATFGAEPMPPEVGGVLVPNVSTARRPLGEATLYDCLLSDDR